MEINRNNYEAYFIDYVEGTLNESLVDSFIDFIKQNPDLKEELALFESISVTPENISFKKKEALYKEKLDAEDEFNTAAIARLEGDFSTEEKAEFENYLAKYPEKEKEALAFSKTKLRPDESIVFSKKNKLYKKSVGRTVLMWSSRVAAILVLAFMLFIFLEKSNKELIPENKLAKVETLQNKQTEVPKVIENQELQETQKQELTKKQLTKVTEPPKKEVVKNVIVKTIQEDIKENVEPIYTDPVRETIVVPAKLNSLLASVEFETPKTEMATMSLYYPEIEEEKLIGERVKEKLNIGKISKAGLNLVTSISNERFSYKTNTEGKVSEYTYDSRLLAFSIPGKKEKQ